MSAPEEKDVKQDEFQDREGRNPEGRDPEGRDTPRERDRGRDRGAGGGPGDGGEQPGGPLGDGGAGDDPPALTADELRRLHELEDENARLHDQMQRAAADIQSMRMRQARDREDLRIRAIEAIALDLLPVLDNLSLALDAHDTQSGGGAEAVVEGVQMVRGLFADALRRHGVDEIDAEGQRFDPRLHEAVGVVPAAEAAAEPGTVVEVVRRGYRIGERVLRASRVVVAGENAPAGGGQAEG